MRDKNLFLEEKYSFLYKTVGRYKNNSSSRSQLHRNLLKSNLLKKKKKIFQRQPDRITLLFHQENHQDLVNSSPNEIHR